MSSGALALSEADIQIDLDRRRPGQSKYTTQRREPDRVTILSGVFEGQTTGAPIALVVDNEDQRSRDYDKIKAQFRPGHADYTYLKKYGLRDYRGSGRASARETVARVAAGAVARKYLAAASGISIRGCMDQIGHIQADRIDWEQVANNPFFFPTIQNSMRLPNLSTPSVEKAIRSVRGSGFAPRGFRQAWANRF